MRASILLLVALVLPLSACATTGGGGGTGFNRNLITQEDLVDAQELSVMAAIQRLRPNWIRGRGFVTPSAAATGDTETRLRIDGVMRQSLSELETIPVRDVEEIRYLSASDATTLYGTGFAMGLIEVTTRGG